MEALPSPGPDAATPQDGNAVVAAAPAVAVGSLLVASAQALANAAHNSTAAAQQAYITSQAATVMTVTQLLGIETVADAVIFS